MFHAIFEASIVELHRRNRISHVLIVSDGLGFCCQSRVHFLVKSTGDFYQEMCSLVTAKTFPHSGSALAISSICSPCKIFYLLLHVLQLCQQDIIYPARNILSNNACDNGHQTWPLVYLVTAVGLSV